MHPQCSSSKFLISNIILWLLNRDFWKFDTQQFFVTVTEAVGYKFRGTNHLLLGKKTTSIVGN
jgi:hypothetical protein